MTAPTPDPASAEVPRPRRRVARTVPGEPAFPAPSPEGTPSSSSLLSVAGAETRRPDPVTGGADPAAASRLPASPGRGRTPQTPAGASEHDSPPAGSQALSGEEQRAAKRKDWKAAQSSQGRERRRRAHKYVPVAKRTAYRPGMGVRKPQKPPGDGAA